MYYLTQCSQQLCKVGTVIRLLLQTTKLQHRERRQTAEGQTASEQLSPVPGPGNVAQSHASHH